MSTGDQLELTSPFPLLNHRSSNRSGGVAESIGDHRCSSFRHLERGVMTVSPLSWRELERVAKGEQKPSLGFPVGQAEFSGLWAP